MSKIILRRNILILLALCLCSLVIYFFVIKENRSPNSNLRILTASWMMDKFELTKVCEDFQRENPGIIVSLDKYDNLDSSFYPLMLKSTQKKYDIILGGSREHIVQYASAGALKEFGNDFFDEDLKREDFFPSFLELGNIGGKQFMIPLMGEVMSIIYRKDLFKSAGLLNKDGDPIVPETWEELYKIAERLTTPEKNGQKTYGINIDMGTNMFAYSLYSSIQAKSGTIFDKHTYDIDTSSEDFKSLLTNWRRLIDTDLAPSYTLKEIDAGRENFKAGKLAMLLAPHSRWTEASQILGIDNVGIMPLPGGARNGSLTYIHGIIIPIESPNKSLAVKFIKQKLLSKDFQSWSMQHYGKIPSLIRNYDVSISPEWNSIFTWVRDSTTLPLYKDWLKLNNSLNQELGKYIMGKQSVEEASEILTEKLKTIDKSSGLGY